MIHRTNCSNPRQDSFSGRLEGLRQRVAAGAEYGCTLCGNSCDGRPDCLAVAMGIAAPGRKGCDIGAGGACDGGCGGFADCSGFEGGADAKSTP